MAYNDVYLNNDFTRETYAQPVFSTTVLDPVIGGTVVSNIAGASGNVSFQGSGLTFTGTAGSSVVTVAGVLDEPNGGTGNSSYTKGDLLAASAAAVLSKLAVGSNNARLAADSSTLTGLIWLLASTGWGSPSGTLSRAAYASYAGQTISAIPTQAEVQQIDDALKLLSQVVAAILTDLLAQKLFNA